MHINESFVAIVAIIMGCGLPLFIVIAVLWFKYQNKQAKYRLASQAITAGKEVPKGLFDEDYSAGSNCNNAVLTKGIKNICLGIGLGVFLWILTNERGIAAIGFLIFCMGVGQVIVAYATRTSDKKDNHFPEIKE